MNTRMHRTMFCAGLAAVAVGCFGSSSNGQPAGALDSGALFDASIHLDGAGGLDAGPGDGSPGSGDAGADAAPGSDGGCPGGGGSGTFSCTGSLAVPRVAPGGAVLTGGKVLVAGGWNSASQTVTSAEVYDPVAGTFAATGPMASAHLWAGWTAPWPVLSSGKVLAAGGLDASGALLASAELFDPTAGTFSPTGPLGTAVIAFDPVTLQDGSVLFLGGYSSVTGAPPTPGWSYYAGTNQVQRYVPTSAAFSPAGTLAEQRLFGCNVLLPSGDVLAIGGWQGQTPTAESNIEQYDPNTSQWSTVGTLASGVTCSVGAFVLPSGQVLLDGSYLLDPVALTTTPTTGALPSTSPALVQLANGDVLALGGQENNVAVAGAQVYGAATGLWKAVGSLHQPRSACRGFLLPSGEVLVVGGADSNGTPLQTAEIYHP